MAEIANATGLSIAGVKKNLRKLKDANLIRRAVARNERKLQ